MRVLFVPIDVFGQFFRFIFSPYTVRQYLKIGEELAG